MIVMTTRYYSELIRLKTFEERYAYLKLGGSVGYSSFGFDRYLNQRFYRSVQWKRIRDEVILRDEGCDLGILDRSIYDKILVHHMNPVSKHELVSENLDLLNPEEGETILDLGCGTGELTFEISKKTPFVTGIDASFF